MTTQIKKPETKKYPALCDTPGELCHLLIYSGYDWHQLLIQDCMNPAIRSDLKAIYREGLRLYHRHIERKLADWAERDELFKV